MKKSDLKLLWKDLNSIGSCPTRLSRILECILAFIVGMLLGVVMYIPQYFIVHVSLLSLMLLCAFALGYRMGRRTGLL